MMSLEINRVMQWVGHDNVQAVRACGRHGINVMKKNGGKSTFFFSAPIRNAAQQYIVRKFGCISHGFTFGGTSANITVSSRGITLADQFGKTVVEWGKEQLFVLSEDGAELRSQDLEITPSLNGVVVKQLCGGNVEYTLHTTLRSGFPERTNSKSFAFMKAKFEPCFTMNALFSEHFASRQLLPLAMRAKNTGQGNYILQMWGFEQGIQRITWEINLYEKKLIQDTTVESAHATENNAFGATAFIGSSKELGRQLLYSRFDFAQIDSAHQRKMAQIKLHIPYYSLGNELRISAPFRRFCSFGSNWGNKMPANDFAATITHDECYISIDLSQYLISKYGTSLPNTGIVLSPKNKEGVAVLATADNYDRPQIIEIQYEKEKKE